MIFPELTYEAEVIEQDRTRIEANKTFISGTEFPISSVQLSVSDYVTSQEIYNAAKKQCTHLDLMLKFQADIDASNQNLKFAENKVEKIAVLTPGTYTLAALVAEIQTQMNAAGDFTYTLTLQEDQSIRIDWPSGDKVELFNRKSPLWEDLGFKDTLYTDVAASTKLIGRPVRTLPVKLTCVVVTTEVDPGIGTNTETITRFMKVYSLATVRLLSNDSMLEIEEPDIKKWVKEGRNTFQNIHLQAQKDIIDWLDKKGYVNLYMEKFTVNDIYSVDEVTNWSKYRALEIIFGGIQNATDDIFKEKSEKYRKLANKARRRILHMDLDRDGRVYSDELLLTDCIKMVRV